MEAGVNSRDANTQRLKKLDLDGLSIADTAFNKQLRAPAPDGKPGTEFNPYNSSPKVGATSSYDTDIAIGDKFATRAEGSAQAHAR